MDMIAMMPSQLSFNYYEWPVKQIKIDTKRSYDDLFERMHNTEFVWIIPGDGNRVQDGLDLRNEFLNDIRSAAQRNEFKKSMIQGATALEVLIALSLRV